MSIRKWARAKLLSWLAISETDNRLRNEIKDLRDRTDRIPSISDKISEIERNIENIQFRLADIKINQPTAGPIIKTAILEGMNQNLQTKIPAMIDSALLRLISENGTLTIEKLIELAETKSICKRASVYRRIDSFEEQGYIVVERDGPRIKFITRKRPVIEDEEELSGQPALGATAG